MFWHDQLPCIIVVVIIDSVHLSNALLGTGKGRKTRTATGLDPVVKGPTSQTTTLRDPTEAADLPAEVAWLGLRGLHLLNQGPGNTNPYL